MGYLQVAAERLRETAALLDREHDRLIMPVQTMTLREAADTLRGLMPETFFTISPPAVNFHATGKPTLGEWEIYVSAGPDNNLSESGFYKGATLADAVNSAIKAAVGERQDTLANVEATVTPTE